jgi:hypothetical protein
MKPNGSGVGAGVGVAIAPKAVAKPKPKSAQPARAVPATRPSVPKPAGQLELPTYPARVDSHQGLVPARGKMRNAPLGSSGQYPMVKVPIPSPKQTSSKPSAKWNCATCGKVLGPQSVQQGNSVLLDGKLLCIGCVRSKPARRQAAVYSTKSLLIAGCSSLAVLVLVSIFFPSHVLFAILLLSLGLIGASVLGGGLNRFVRAGVLAGGVCALALSAFGLISLRQQASNKLADAAMAVQGDEIQADLKNDCLLEAQLRIDALESKSGKDAGISKQRIAELKGEVDACIKQNYGDLSADERTLLFDLQRKFGSRTNNQTRRVRALKLDAQSIQLTLALDAPQREDEAPQDRALNLKDGPQTIRSSSTSNPTLDQAHEILMYVFAKQPAATAISLKLESSQGAELATINVDNQDLQTLKQGDVAPLLKFSSQLPP